MQQHTVITGGTGGLGKAIAKELLEAGWEVEAPGSTELDVRDKIAISHFFEKKTVDLLVCAAGMTSDNPLPRLSLENWEKTWDVNFRGAKACADAVLPGMKERKTGHVVFLSSFSAISPPIGQVAYATAKASLLGLTKDLAQKYGNSNIRVNVVLPGFLETRMTEAVTEKRRDAVLEAHSLRRFNTCVAAARFIRFLHEQMPHTSGQVFQLDSRVL